MANSNSLTLDLDNIPNKRSIKFIAPDKDGLFEIQAIVDGNATTKLIPKEEALQIVQFLVKYL